MQGKLLMPLTLPISGIWNKYMCSLKKSYKIPVPSRPHIDREFLGSHTFLSELVLQRRTGVKMATQETFQRSNLINCDIFSTTQRKKGNRLRKVMKLCH